MELRKEEDRSLGLVWVDCPDSVVALGLREALKAQARVCCGRRAPVGLGPSLVVICAEAEAEVAPEVERAKAAAPHVPVVVLGLSADLPLARAAMRSGASGFVHVGMRPEQFARALSLAKRGEVVVPRELLAGLVTQEEDHRAAKPPLTPRQAELLGLVAEGLTNAQIAERVFLSEFTVKQHLRAAYKTLGVKSRTQAAKAYRQGYSIGGVGNTEERLIANLAELP